MKVLFSHDSLLKKDSKNNYYSTTLNNDAFKRYFDIADEITIVMRTKQFNNDLDAKDFSKITLDNLKVVESPDISNLTGQLRDKKVARKIIHNEVLKADYVVVRLPSFLGMLTYDVAQQLGKPCLVELVGCSWDAFWNHSIQGKFIAPYMYKATRRKVKKADYVVYVTNEFLQRRYPTNGEETNCSNVVLNKFDDQILETRIKKIESLNSSNKIILGTTAAIDVKYKGQQYIIEALGNLKRRGIDNFEYQLVGNGKEDFLREVAIEHNVLDQVKFIGPIKHKQVFNWLDHIDLYAQPSRQEGLPRALIEAMSRGLPAIGARTAGIPELLTEKSIFSNTTKNIDEITNILLSINIPSLKKQAIRNYNESKKYNKSTIEKRRKNFFNMFRDNHHGDNK